MKGEPDKMAKICDTAADAAKLETAKTLQSQELKIDTSKWHLHNKMKINDTNVVTADVLADNKVIHVIDKAIIPKYASVLTFSGA